MSAFGTKRTLPSLAFFHGGKRCSLTEARVHPMLARTETNLTITERWLAQFERALGEGDDALLQALFHADSHWRDVLSLTWRIMTVNGGGAILKDLRKHSERVRPHSFKVPSHRAAPRTVTRAGTDSIEAIFTFETTEGRGSGVVRLRPDADNTPKAWTLLTALDEIKGHEEQLGRSRPQGKAYSRDFHGPNWLDNRRAATEYADRDPAVLVVGGGQAGLSAAACLTQLGVDTLVADREKRMGDNWRKRYHALVLHNQVHVNHLPYMHFPPNWPAYIPKDKIAGWFEAYAASMELNFWTATEFEGGCYDEKAHRWSMTLPLADCSKCEMHPRHIVPSSAVCGIPNLPGMPTLGKFSGKVLHSSQYDDGAAWKGKNVLVIGSGNSGHDIAQELYSNGAKVTLVQRSSTLIVNVEPSAQLPYALYDEGPSLEDCDLITASIPLAVAKRSHILLTQQAKDLDKDLLDGLERKGFRLDFGEDGSGWQFKYLTRGGGYYFNVGCSDLIVKGEIGLAQFSDTRAFVAHGVQMRSGETIPADLIILATGYKGQEHLVGKLFGNDVVTRVGPIWGFGEGDELRNMFTRTAQPGLWFIAGSFAQCRIYSKYLALQIKASEIGLIR